MVRLAMPLVLAELGWMLMGIVDTMMVGRVSAAAIGAVGLGTTVFYIVAITSGGILLGLDTLVSQAFGAGDSEDCRRSLISGIWLALLLIVPVMLIMEAAIAMLPRFGVDPSVIADVEPYLRVLNWSAPPLLVYFAFRRYLQSCHIARPVMITLITANVVNLAVNWILVFGNLGAPRLGAAGAGWATCLSRIYMMAALGVVIWRHDRGHAARFRGGRTWRRMRELIALGLPAAGTDGRGDRRIRDGDGADRKIERDRAGRTPDRADHGEHHLHDAAGNQLGCGGAGGKRDRARRSGRRGARGMDGAGVGRNGDVVRGGGAVG